MKVFKIIVFQKKVNISCQGNLSVLRFFSTQGNFLTRMAKKPTPKQKHARASGRSRYSKFQFEARKRLSNMIHLIPCSNCGKPKVTHMICHACGYYGGKMIIDKSKEIKKKVTTVTA